MTFRKEEWNKIGILKGILISLVVLGHAVGISADTPAYDMAFHDIIFWFHMPLFFALSGAAYKGGTGTGAYALKKVKRFLPPYLAWFVLITAIQGSIMYPKPWLRFLWGGRACGGVYWYITVLLLTAILFAFLDNHIRAKKVMVAVLFLCLTAAAVESNFMPEEAWTGDLLEPLHCIPWNADVTLAAVFYYGMGSVCKDLLSEERITQLIRRKIVRIMLPVAAALVFAVLAVLRLKGVFMYGIDMKYVKYYNLILDLVLPGLAAVVLLYVTRLLAKSKVLTHVISEAGAASLVIMYSHLLILNTGVKIIPAFTGRTLVLTVAAVVIGYAVYALFRLNKITKVLFISGINTKTK